MSKHIGGLGRGLGSLIPHNKPATPPSVQSGERVLLLAPDTIKVNPDQPRFHFDPSSLDELTESIREHGILQPLIVMREGSDHVLISGERRLRAAKKLQLKEVPAILREADEQKRLELALIENIQRQDLNPMELADAYAKLLDEFGLTHDELAKRLGQKRATVSNILRLRDLPGRVQEAIASGEITLGHAKVLAGMESETEQLAMLDQILQGNFSVRRTEVESRGGNNRNAGAPKFKHKAILDPNIRAKQEQLEEALGTDVHIIDRGGKGQLVIRYYSPEELHAITKRIAS